MPTHRAAPHEEIAVLKILRKAHAVCAAGFRNDVADAILPFALTLVGLTACTAVIALVVA